MKQYLRAWKRYINDGRILNEMRYIERMFLPQDFIDTLPEDVRDMVNEYDVLDFAFEEYKNIFPQYVLGGVNPIKFFVPYVNGELFFDYSTDDDHRIVREPTEQEYLARGVSIPVLPDNWYNAFLKHYNHQMLPERKTKVKLR